MIATWTAEERLAIAKPWEPEERKRWRAERPMSVSDWCDRFRVIAGSDAIEPGPWRTDRTPYLREILDACGPDSGYEEITFLASARIGKSECGKCAVSYWAANNGQTILLVFPDESRAKEEIRDHYEPMLKASPVLSELFTDRLWDVKASRINLRTCTIRVGWSRSATTLAGFQAPLQHHEEKDKWGQPRKEANPANLAKARAMQFGDQKRILSTSTPTLPGGPIDKDYTECSDRRRYHIPCPHCSEFTQLLWENTRWEGFDPDWQKLSREARIALRDELATGQRRTWVNCERCSGKITDGHKMRAYMSPETCAWISEGYPPGRRPRSNQVAFRINTLYSPWVEFHRMAAEGVKLHLEGPKGWQHFVNSWCGEVYQPKGRGITVGLIEVCSSPAFLPLIAPDWAKALCAGADTQQDHLVWVIRAFGAGGLTRGIDYGHARTWDEFADLVLRRTFRVEGIATRTMRVAICGIDIGAGGKDDADQLQGNRTDEVYRFIAKHPQVMRALKGRGGQFFPNEQPPFVEGKSGKGKLHGVPVSVVNRQHYMSQASGLMHEGLWQEPTDLSPDYKAQMSAHQIVVKERAGRRFMWWQKRYKNIADHFLDASCNALVAADLLNVEAIPTAAAGHARDQLKAKSARKRRQRPGWSQSTQWDTGTRGRGW